MYLQPILQGTILDIGGGGEGVIGRLYGKQVTAIDNKLDTQSCESITALCQEAGLKAVASTVSVGQLYMLFEK